MRAVVYYLLFLLAARCGAANLLPNSSFEFGPQSWSVSGTIIPITSLLTNGGSHGASAFVLPSGVRLQSGPIQLAAGSYSLSFDGRCPGGLQGPYWAGVVASPVADPALSVGNFELAWGRKVVPITVPSNGLYYVKFESNQPEDGWIDAVQLEAGAATPYEPQVKATQSLLCVWEANKESFCAGYRLYSGPTARRYTFTNTIVGRLNTNGTVPMLPGANFVAVRAYAADGAESAFSQEVLWISRSSPTSPPAVPTRFRISGATLLIQETVP